jgi:general secretion pathway protein G
MTRRTVRRAFTLIELLLVLVILAVLAAVVVPRMTSRVGESRRSATIASISNLESAMEQFEIDCGRYPTSAEGLEALVAKPTSLDATANWHNYIKEVPMDGWGRAFIYKGPDSSSVTGDYELSSMGDDGQENTDDDINRYTKK